MAKAASNACLPTYLFEYQREGSVEAAHALHGTLQVQKALLLHHRRYLSSKTSSALWIVWNLRIRDFIAFCLRELRGWLPSDLSCRPIEWRPPCPRAAGSLSRSARKKYLEPLPYHTPTTKYASLHKRVQYHPHPILVLPQPTFRSTSICPPHPTMVTSVPTLSTLATPNGTE